MPCICPIIICSLKSNIFLLYILIFCCVCHSPLCLLGIIQHGVLNRTGIYLWHLYSRVHYHPLFQVLLLSLNLLAAYSFFSYSTELEVPNMLKDLRYFRGKHVYLLQCFRAELFLFLGLTNTLRDYHFNFWQSTKDSDMSLWVLCP